MKQFLINIIGRIYLFLSLCILGTAMLLPFTFEMKDFKTYILWIYPLALIIIASQKQMLQYLDDNNFMT